MKHIIIYPSTLGGKKIAYKLDIKNEYTKDNMKLLF